MVEYYKKYLKYKAKYLNLVNMKGGWNWAIKVVVVKDVNDKIVTGSNQVEDEEIDYSQRPSAFLQLQKLGRQIALRFHNNEETTITKLNGFTATTEFFYSQSEPAAGISARQYFLQKYDGFTDITPIELQKGGPFILKVKFSDLMKAVVEPTVQPSIELAEPVVEVYTEEELEQLKKHMRKLIKSGLSDKDIMDIIDKMRQ